MPCVEEPTTAIVKRRGAGQRLNNARKVLVRVTCYSARASSVLARTQVASAMAMHQARLAVTFAPEQCMIHDDVDSHSVLEPSVPSDASEVEDSVVSDDYSLDRHMPQALETAIAGVAPM